MDPPDLINEMERPRRFKKGQELQFTAKTEKFCATTKGDVLAEIDLGPNMRLTK